jgi:hypothetical protein
MTTIAHPEFEGLDRYKFGWADSSPERRPRTGSDTGLALPGSSIISS